jgi:hypothetical protein
MAQRSTGPDLGLADLGHLSRSRLRDLWQKELGEKEGSALRSTSAAHENQLREEYWSTDARRRDRRHDQLNRTRFR